MERCSRGFPKPRGRALKPSPPARLLLTGGFTLKPRGRAPASLVCCAIAHLVWHGGVSRNPNDERHSHTRPGLSLFFLFGYIPTVVYFVVTFFLLAHMFWAHLRYIATVVYILKRFPMIFFVPPVWRGVREGFRNPLVEPSNPLHQLDCY